VGRAKVLAVLQGEAMLRKVVCAAVILVLCVGVAMSDEFLASITKVDGDKVTFAELKGKEKGAEKTLTVAKDAKIVKGKFNKDTMKFDAGDPIDGGLKAEVFTKIDSEKGMKAMIITDKDNKHITEIRVGGKGKKQ
jgi:hypothetical protein